MNAQSNRVGIVFSANSKDYASSPAGDVRVFVWFDNSSYPGQITCMGVTSFGTRLCKSMNF